MINYWKPSRVNPQTSNPKTLLIPQPKCWIPPLNCIGLGCPRWETQWLWHPFRDEGRRNGNKVWDERGWWNEQWNEQWSQVLLFKRHIKSYYHD